MSIRRREGFPILKDQVIAGSKSVKVMSDAVSTLHRLSDKPLLEQSMYDRAVANRQLPFVQRLIVVNGVTTVPNATMRMLEAEYPNGRSHYDIIVRFLKTCPEELKDVSILASSDVRFPVSIVLYCENNINELLELSNKSSKVELTTRDIYLLTYSRGLGSMTDEQKAAASAKGFDKGIGRMTDEQKAAAFDKGLGRMTAEMRMRANRTILRTNTSGVTGVGYSKSRNNFHIDIQSNGIKSRAYVACNHLGKNDTEAFEAAIDIRREMERKRDANLL